MPPCRSRVRIYAAFRAVLGSISTTTAAAPSPSSFPFSKLSGRMTIHRLGHLRTPGIGGSVAEQKGAKFCSLEVSLCFLLLRCVKFRSKFFHGISLFFYLQSN